MLNPREAVKLSKLMGLALRHNPAAFDLTPDRDGWVPALALLAGLARQPRWQWVRLEHIRHIVDTSDKQRFELEGALIRARYGHSRAARPTYQSVVPPRQLFHGTPRCNLVAIRREGLKAMARQYVHLSATVEMALRVGRRRDERPALLRIRAAAAYTAGGP